MRKAFVIGATGLVGREIVKALLTEKRVDQVTAFVRKPGALAALGITSDLKLSERSVNFEDLIRGKTNWFQDLENCEHAVLFSALGTTIKQAGTKDQQKLIDLTYQLKSAEQYKSATATTGTSATYVLISAIGASKASPFFYSKIKGELEEAVMQLGFQKTHILRPSLLLGKREQGRFGESAAASVFEFIKKIGLSLPKAVEPIHAKDVAKSAIRSALENDAKTLIFQPQAETEI
jgi:uncharacterized protein YbjT (DUF2867 family)